MPIRLLDYPDHSTYGFRIEAGAKHRRYLTLLVPVKGQRHKRRANRQETKTIREKAKMIEKELKILQRRDAESRNIERRTNTERRQKQPGMTRVCGISLSIHRNPRGDKVYEYPVFTVNIAGVHPKRFFISKHGWMGAWKQAVYFVALHKGIEDIEDVRHLIRKIPKKSQLMKLKAYQESRS